MRIKKCTVCGTEFESHNGIEVCSEACRAERKRRQDAIGNYKRRNHLSGIPKNKTCPICGNTFEAVGCAKYCGLKCRETARKRMSAENFKERYADPRWRAEHIANVIKNRSR